MVVVDVRGVVVLSGAGPVVLSGADSEDGVGATRGACRCIARSLQLLHTVIQWMELSQSIASATAPMSTHSFPRPPRVQQPHSKGTSTVLYCSGHSQATVATLTERLWPLWTGQWLRQSIAFTG